jgi:hypothetical protein
MIKVFSKEKKGTYNIIAVADHQKDINNLRLMSYAIYDGVDKVQLNKEEFGGPYIKLKCDDYKDEDGKYDLAAIQNKIVDLQNQYN